MDSNPELMPRATVRTPSSGNRRGIAMVTAIFALVIVGILVAGMYNLSNLQARAVRNRTASARALLLAEAGAAHAVMLLRDTLATRSNTYLLRGADNNAASTGDNGRLIGYGMSSGVEIPAAGFATTGGRYWVQITDDAADADGDPNRDSNQRLILRCRAATADSAYATIDVLVSGVGLLPGLLSNGNTSLTGSTTMTGACGDIHANGNLTFGAVTPVTGDVTSTGAIAGSAYAVTTGFKSGNQPPMDVPNIGYNTFCPASADYIARTNGWIVRPKIGDSLLASGTPRWGTKRSSTSPLSWDISGNTMGAGFWCFTGNVKLSGNAGSDGAPLTASIVASGSVEVSGNPYLVPASADSITIVAGGDVAISGNPGAASPNYGGLIYAGAQCKVSGNPRLFGQVVCRNSANPAGSIEYVATTEVSGNPQISYACGGYFNQPRRILQWVQLVQ